MTSHERKLKKELSIVKDHGDSFLQKTLDNGLAKDQRNIIENLLRSCEERNMKGLEKMTAEDELESKLEAIEVKVCTDQTIYPLMSLRQALTKDIVQRMLKEKGHKKRVEKNAAIISSSYCRILSILVQIEKSGSILAFLDERLDDSHLPLQLTR